MGAAESLAGRVLAEKYLLIERLGEGGFGSIWRAEHRILKSPVAVKLIDLDMARKDGAVERFLREAQATAALRSPHVVQVLDYGVDGDQPFIVMELLEGENLADRLTRVGALEPAEAARVVTHVARAIGKAHELGIVHRDLKPENIFIVNNGDAEVAKVLDFGVAKFAANVDIKQSTYTITGSLVGTPYYMSPEQAQGNKTVDHRSDLWALGVITFEMLTGRRPFDGDALGDLVLTICVRTIAIPSAVAPVPPGFDSWFARAVERNPEDRFQSAREMAIALLRMIEGDARDGLTDGRPSLRSSVPELEMALELPSRPVTPVAELPSRPAASAFAATMRDDALALGMLNGGSLVPPSVAIAASRFPQAPGSNSSPTADPPAVDPLASLSSAHATGFGVDDSVDESEEHLTPWSVVGIALLALAAGAAAVYGAFSLLRAHESSSDPVEPMASASSSARAVTATAKRRFDVIATGKPNSPIEAPGAKQPRANADTASMRERASEGASRQATAGAPESAPLEPGLSSAPPASNAPAPATSASLAPAATAPLPLPAAPPENLAPGSAPGSPSAAPPSVPQSMTVPDDIEPLLPPLVKAPLTDSVQTPAEQ